MNNNFDKYVFSKLFSNAEKPLLDYNAGFRDLQPYHILAR